jgi:hypothetical protein
MKLRIGDQEYDYQRAMQTVGLAHLLELQEKSGVGRRTIVEGLAALEDAVTRREGESDEEYLERGLSADNDPKILRALPGLIFVCKRHAGEKISVEDAGSIGWDGFQFVIEDSDLKPVDPTTASGDQSQPDAETPNGPSSSGRSSVPTGSRKKSKTSKATSTGE